MFKRLAILLLLTVAASAQVQTPDVGVTAPDFTLTTPAGEKVSLAALKQQGPVALIFLRGYPGYQCAYCMRQVHDLAAQSAKFADRHIQLLLVYPGKASQLADRASEFTAKGGTLPANFHLVIDPDFQVTELYALRWSAAGETAYPSAFLIDPSGKILYRKISHTHADRATPEDILAAAPRN